MDYTTPRPQTVTWVTNLRIGTNNTLKVLKTEVILEL